MERQGTINCSKITAQCEILGKEFSYSLQCGFKSAGMERFDIKDGIFERERIQGEKRKVRGKYDYDLVWDDEDEQKTDL